MAPLGLRGLSQLSCRESGLRAVKTSGPGALGVLSVKGDPAGAQARGQKVVGRIPAGGCTQRLYNELGDLRYPNS